MIEFFCWLHRRINVLEISDECSSGGHKKDFGGTAGIQSHNLSRPYIQRHFGGRRREDTHRRHSLPPKVSRQFSEGKGVLAGGTEPRHTEDGASMLPVDKNFLIESSA